MKWGGWVRGVGWVVLGGYGLAGIGIDWEVGYRTCFAVCAVLCKSVAFIFYST